MIYDLGCSSAELWQRIASALPGVMAVTGLTAGIVALGAQCNRSGFRSVDIFCGWAIVAAVMTLGAISAGGILPYIAGALAIAMLAALILTARQRKFSLPFWLLLLFPGLPILIALNISGIAKWDDFTHWVPNALYIYQYDGLPSHASPPTISAWPGYPYALPFATYLASHLAGGFLMQGGAMINFVFLLGFAVTLTEIYPARKTFAGTLGLAGIALLLTTIANPSFNASFTMTSQGDTSTMVITALLGILLWRCVDALKQNDKMDVHRMTFVIALLAMLLILIKQVNIVTLALMMFAWLVVAWKNKILKPALWQLPVMLAPALIMRFAWHWYVGAQMSGNGFGIRPLHEWRFDLIGPLVRSMLHEMLKKNGCFALMMATSIYGLLALRKPPTPVRNFALLTALVFLGYQGFLFTAYIGSTFSEAEVSRAASFYRYSTQIGLLGIAFIWIAAPTIFAFLYRKYSRPWTAVTACAPLLILPLVFFIHADALVPQPGPVACAIRNLGRSTAAVLPDKARVAFIDPEDMGLKASMINFEFALASLRDSRSATLVWFINSYNADTLASRLAAFSQNPDADFILINKAEHHPRNVLGYSNEQGPVLLRRDGNGWNRVF